MRLLLSAAALCCVLSIVPPAAGATRPFDFELAPRSGEAGAASARTLHTPRQFNLVGMRWRGGEADVRLRVRRPGRGWSRWQELEAHADHNPDPRRGEPARTASDPLWVGRGDAVQYRASRRLPGLRLHFVNVGDRRARAAQDPQPEVVTRAEWGASGCPPRRSPGYGTVKAVHVHHTVSLNDYSPQEAPSIVLAICRYHRNSNGWDDIGYNALVDKYGVLYEGRAGGLDQAVIGAQAQGFNSETAGIASIGDHTSVGATPETLDALARYIRWKLQIHGQPLSGTVRVRSSGGSATNYPAGSYATLERVSGHRDTGKTACPGQLLYDQLDELRAMVSTGVATVPSYATRLSAALAYRAVDYGTIVPVTGLLAGPDGAPLAGQEIDVEVNSEGGWVTSKRLLSASDGTFATELKPRKRMYVRVRYPGSADLRGAFSSRLLLRLRPVITLLPPVSRSVAGERVQVRGTIGPRKRFVQLVLQQHVRGRYRTVGSRAVRVRRGRIRTSFVPAYVDRYRYALISRSDDDTDRSSTGWLPLRTTG